MNEPVKYLLVRESDTYYKVVELETGNVVFSATGPSAADGAICHVMHHGPVHITKADN